MSWISVTDQLPKLPVNSTDKASGVPVVVACADGRVLPARWAEPRFVRRPLPIPPQWEEFDGTRLLPHVVTHWMPYPPHPDTGMMFEGAYNALPPQGDTSAGTYPLPASPSLDCD